MTAIAFETTGPLAVITMTHEPHNLLGPDLMEPLLDALQRASSQHARAVLLKSGLRHFCAGADLASFQNHTDGATFDAVGTLRAFEEYPLPILCAVHGLCLGGGFELALACDYLVAARSARLGSVEATIGLHPLVGAAQRVAQRAGALRAKEMAMLGRRYDPDRSAHRHQGAGVGRGQRRGRGGRRGDEAGAATHLGLCGRGRGAALVRGERPWRGAIRGPMR
jgi:enoyl-CoA hydratase/carnithine racemase